MSDFAKSFLRDRLGDDQRPCKVLGLFGKHPGWDDHIEDLPLPTPSMVAAKQLLYVDGIGAQISSGGWAKLPAENVLPGFDHLFLWLRGDQFLAGRIWASKDGKKRAHFPMIAVCQGFAVPPAIGLPGVWSELNRMAAGCQAVKDAESVRQQMADWIWETEGFITDMPDPSTAPPATLHVSRGAVAQFVESIQKKGFTSLRLPADPQDPTRAIDFWSRLASTSSAASQPLLFLAPRGQDWMDVVAGEPKRESLFCLRARPTALPIATPESEADPAEELDVSELLKATPASAAGGEAEKGWLSRLWRR